MFVRNSLLLCAALSAGALAVTGTFTDLDLRGNFGTRVSWGYPYSYPYAGAGLFAGVDVNSTGTNFYSSDYVVPNASVLPVPGKMTFGLKATGPYWLTMKKDTINLGDPALVTNAYVYGALNVTAVGNSISAVKIAKPTIPDFSNPTYAVLDTVLTWGHIPSVAGDYQLSQNGISWGLKEGTKYNSAQSNYKTSTTSFYAGNFNFPAAGTPYPGRMTFGLTSSAPFWLALEKDSIRIGDPGLATNARVYGNLDVTGKATIAGNTTITGTATVTGPTATGPATINGPATILGTATIVGGTNVGGVATFNGPANFGSLVTINGSTSIGNTITVAGLATMNGDAVVKGKLYLGTSGWSVSAPDYVFASDYNLAPIAEVENYVRTNRHLPGIASASDMEKNGHIDMVQMNLDLLKKVEELTLYVIDQNKKIEELQKSIGSKN